MFEVHLDSVIADLFTVKVDFHLYGRLDTSETGKLMEVSSEGIPGMIEGFIACADEASSLNDVMALIKCRSSEVFVDWVNLEVGKGVNGSDCVLPDIPNKIVEVTIFKKIDWIGRHPVFHIDVTH